MKKNRKVLEISRGNKMHQVVEITVLEGEVNRKGKPYKLSVTKHLSLNPKTKKGVSDAK